MSYGRADTSAKVGFRPYHLTDAFGAAHLSGYGSGLGQNHPFKPTAWHLHGVDPDGLGAYEFNRPFDPWELHTGGPAGLHGLGDLGDLGAGTDVVAQAADELLRGGQITQAEHDAIVLDGSMTFQDVLGYDPTDSSSWADLVSVFRNWNNDLIALEQQYAAAGGAAQQGNTAFQQLGRDLISERQQYAALATQFVQYYTLLMGSTPSGLSGLGIAIAVWVAGAAIFVVTAYLTYQAFQNWKASINVSQIAAQTSAAAQQSTAQTNAQLTAALQRAQASGDTITAQSILNTLKSTGAAPPGSAPMSQLEAWFTGNMKWIGLGLGALVVLPGLVGGRRR
jgi:hypothetical protein